MKVNNMSETTSDREILTLVSDDGDSYEVSLSYIPFWTKWICVDEEGAIACYDATGECKHVADYGGLPKAGKELSWELKVEIKPYVQQMKED